SYSESENGMSAFGGKADLMSSFRGFRFDVIRVSPLTRGKAVVLRSSAELIVVLAVPAMRASYRHDNDAQAGFRPPDTAAGYELWGLCNDHLLFHQSPNAGPIFCFLLRSKVQGDSNEYLHS